jgi:phage shock protein C
MTNDRSINTAQTPRLYRSSQDRVLGGVCAGIAEYFGRDIVLVRLAAVVLAVISGGVGVFAYLVAWALIPSASGHRAARRKDVDQQGDQHPVVAHETPRRAQ